MKELKVPKAQAIGILTALIFVGALFGSALYFKNAVKVLLGWDNTDLKVAVNKYRYDSKEASKWQSALAPFCLDVVGPEVKLHTGCRGKMRDIEVCGVQNEGKQGWSDAFLKVEAKSLAKKLEASAKKIGCSELVIDFEGVEVEQATFELWLKGFVEALRPSFKVHFAAYAKNQKTVSHSPANRQSYEFLCGNFSEIWVMSYDYSIPPYTVIGELAPLQWVEEVADYALRFCAPGQIRMGLAAYGYNWDNGEIIAEKDYFGGPENVSVETFQKRSKKVEALKGLGVNKFFIWSLGMFDKPF